MEDSKLNFLTSSDLTTPGVSLNTIWVSFWLRTACDEDRVVWCFLECGQALPPTSWLINVLLPALGIPRRQTFNNFCWWFCWKIGASSNFACWDGFNLGSLWYSGSIVNCSKEVSLFFCKERLVEKVFEVCKCHLRIVQWMPKDKTRISRVTSTLTKISEFFCTLLSNYFSII